MMTGTEKILAHIDADAREKADAVLKAAEEKCAAIRAEYEQKASALYSSRIREGVKACQDREDGALRISRMEARKCMLAVKQEMVSKSFDMAKDSIVDLPEAEYVAFLKKLAEKAGAAEGGEIILNSRDRASIGEKLITALNSGSAELRLSEETRDIAGGLILRKGNVEANSSVELLIDMVRGELSGKLADQLFA